MLSKFYQNKVEEIKLRYENICEFVKHNGEKGVENEQIIIDFLKDFLPQSYSIGRGFLIDKNGNTSNQCDIVIYDNFYNPNLIKLNSNTYFPVESVYCVIEVKTTLRDGDWKKSFEDMQKIQKLDFIEENITFTKGNGVYFSKTTRPSYFLFSYQTDTNNSETIVSKLKQYPLEMCFILNAGILRKIIEKVDQKDVSSVLFDISYVTDLQNKLTKEEKDSFLSTAEKGEKFFNFNCTKYPLLKKGKEVYLIDYVKNFLIFLFLLNHNVTAKNVGNNYLQHYFPLKNVISIKETL